MASKKEHFAFKILARDLEEVKGERPEEFKSDESLSDSSDENDLSEEIKGEGNHANGKIIRLLNQAD